VILRFSFLFLNPYACPSHLTNYLLTWNTLLAADFFFFFFFLFFPFAFFFWVRKGVGWPVRPLFFFFFFLGFLFLRLIFFFFRPLISLCVYRVSQDSITGPYIVVRATHECVPGEILSPISKKFLTRRGANSTRSWDFTISRSFRGIILPRVISRLFFPLAG